MKRMLQPSAESADSIRDWLESAGINRIEQGLTCPSQPLRIRQYPLVPEQSVASGADQHAVCENYGNHFHTHEEMKRMLQPSAESADSIRDWLESAGNHSLFESGSIPLCQSNL
jgi:hypothetical protein